MTGNSGSKFLAGWKQLDDTSKNKLLKALQDDPPFQPRDIPQVKKGAVHMHLIKVTVPHIYSNIQLHPYLSYLYYYPIVQWSLDKTLDTDDYWV